MLSSYFRLSRRIKPVLWALTIAGILCTLPLAFQRIETERSSRSVEFVFDYRDLLEVSAFRSKPSEYTLERLIEMKEAGIHSMAVYESSLRELELSGRIQSLSSSEAAILTGFKVPANDKSTYVLFLGDASERLIRPLVEEAFSALQVEVTPWQYDGLQGLKIAMPKDQASLQAMDPDPITMAELQKLGFHLVIRLTDQRPFNQEHMEKLLDGLAERGINRIIFEGSAVTGMKDNAEKNSLAAMAEMMNERGIGLATIELAKPQKGLNTLAYLTDYNVVRLHSLPANMSGRSSDDLSDRFALAVQDRNIRMIFLNVQASMDAENGVRKDTIGNVLLSLRGPEGALARIQKEGSTLGEAKPFVKADLFPANGAELPLKAVATLGAIALIALMFELFFPRLALAVFALGLIGSAGLYVLSPSLLAQGLALGAGIAAPTIAIVFALRRASARKASHRNEAGTAFGAALYGVRLLAVTTAVSFAGIFYIVGLLQEVSYLYVLQQFRGVSLLHLLPIVLAFGYLLFFHRERENDNRSALKRIVDFLQTNVTVLWVIIAGIGGLAVLYYLSRTGNAGQTSDLERLFRQTLQDTLGVRPRTKEFLFAHPIFVLGVYLTVFARQRLGLFLIAAASIGQLSAVDTFAHLHTPVFISFIRVMYGVIFGAMIGVILTAVWRIADKGWRVWAKSIIKE
ncbi:DUF5693 family protein [Paenibacillus thermotolerans]|uniref:DUF5693 family protein n=1 Tax=Paenibacillus thermotolerans TaxID=3027807 RepID=UPI0023678F28|nr:MULTISPECIES: DUF5693 family protein [unclassified Paenibacillus]